MRLSQRNYGNLILLLASLNSVKLFFYGSKIFDMVSVAITFIVLGGILLSSRLIRNVRVIVLLMSATVSLLVTAVLNGGWGSVLNYFILMFCSMLFSSYGCDQKQLRKIFAISGCIILSFLLSLDKQRNYSTFLFNTIMGNAVNSNMVGMVALYAFFSLLYVSLGVKSRVLRASLCGVSTVTCIYYILISECRSALLAVVVFLLLSLFKKMSFNEITFRKLLLFIQMGSLLFVVSYLYLYHISVNISVGLWGKSFFSGRQIVWSSAFDIIASHTIIGAGNSAPLDGVGGSHTLSAHNTVMSILYVFGLIPLVCFYSFFGKKYDKGNCCKQNRFGQFVILSIMVITYLESFYMESYLCFIFMLFFIPLVENNV